MGRGRYPQLCQADGGRMFSWQRRSCCPRRCTSSPTTTRPPRYAPSQPPQTPWLPLGRSCWPWPLSGWSLSTTPALLAPYDVPQFQAMTPASPQRGAWNEACTDHQWVWQPLVPVMAAPTFICSHLPTPLPLALCLQSQLRLPLWSRYSPWPSCLSSARRRFRAVPPPSLPAAPLPRSVCTWGCDNQPVYVAWTSRAWLSL